MPIDESTQEETESPAPKLSDDDDGKSLEWVRRDASESGDGADETEELERLMEGVPVEQPLDTLIVPEPAATNAEEKRTFSREDERVLRERAVDPAFAADLGCHSIDMAEVQRLRKMGHDPYPGLGAPPVRGLLIPYDGVWAPVDGVRHFRLRVTSKTFYDKNDDRQEAKRYYASKGGVVPFWTREVVAVAGDVTVAVYVTEAPLKAMSLSHNGFPAIGMGGVSAGAHDVDVKKETGEIVASPDFKKIKWKGRRMYIVYDASLTDPKKPGVSLGAAYLTLAAREQGADVWLVRIPHSHPQDTDVDQGVIAWETDQGPDDFLARHGPEAFLSLLSFDETCHPLDPTERLRQAQMVLDDCLTESKETRADRKTRAVKLLSDLPTLAYLYAAGPVTLSEFVNFSGLSLREVNAAVATFRERLAPKTEEGHAAFVVENGCFNIRKGDGLEPISNFTARIVRAVDYRTANGETESKWTIEGSVEGKAPVETIVDPVDFHRCEPWWSAFGPQASIVAGKSTKDMVRQAVQEHSPDVPRETVYQHTGWIRDGESWVYLHAGGAIGGTGKRVELPDKYAHFRFPEKTVDGPELVQSILLTRKLLRMADCTVGMTLFALNRLAVLTNILNPAFSVWLIGETQAGKSEVARLFQREFGTFGGRGLVQNFESTPTSVERAMNRVKDAMLVIDDYCPKGTQKEADRQKALAHNIIRAAGNGQSRGRALSSTEERADYPPMGLVLCTAEHDPVGDDGAASLNARTLKLALRKGAGIEDGGLDWSVVTELQGELARDPAALSRAMHAWIAWIAPQYEALRQSLVAERDELLAGLRSEYGSRLGARQPDIVANLLVAARLYQRFVLEHIDRYEVGTVDDFERTLLKALVVTAKEQHDADDLRAPEMVYMRSVEALLQSRRITLAPGPDCMSGTDVGWYDGQVAHLVAPLVDEAVGSHLQRSNKRVALPYDDIRKAMRQRGWLEPDGANLLWKARVSLSTERPRMVMRVPFSAFAIDLAKIVAAEQERSEGTFGSN